MNVDAALLAEQLAKLGRDLETQTNNLAELEDETVTREAEYRKLAELHADAESRAYLDADGTQETKKATARLACIGTRNVANEALTDLNRAKAVIRYQNASISALKVRIDIGRSLLSREKSLMALEQSGVSI